MPAVGLLDYVFTKYGWTEDEYLSTRWGLWEELQKYWAGRAFVQNMKKKAPEATNTRDLLALAKQEGFDVDPTWDAEVSDNA